jgi:hypothetical protein
MPRKTIYIAAPYRGTPEQIQARMAVVAAFARWIRSQGHFVISPLFQHWTFDPAHEEVGDGQYWLDLSSNMILDMARNEANAETWVLLLPGWLQSTGLALEIDTSAEIGIRVRYFQVPDQVDEMPATTWTEVLKEDLTPSVLGKI